MRYLTIYNTLSCGLWSVVLLRTLLLLPLVGPDQIHPALHTFTKYTQTLAVLEVFHILLGLLLTTLPTTVLQVASRLFLVWYVADVYDAPQRSDAYSTMLLAWSVTEVLRYAYYVRILAGMRVEGAWSWLRYNSFWVLYPLGAGSEAWCCYKALGEAKGWEWRLLVAVLVAYPPGLFNQYTHMMRQRRKMMRGKKKV